MSLGAGLYEAPRAGDIFGVPLLEFRARLTTPLSVGVPQLAAANIWTALQTIDLGSGVLPASTAAQPVLRHAVSNNGSPGLEYYGFGTGTALQVFPHLAAGTRSVPLYPTSGQSFYQLNNRAWDESLNGFYTSSVGRLLFLASENHTASAKGTKWSVTQVNRGTVAQATALDFVDQRLMHMGEGASAPSANTFSGNVFFGCNNGTAPVSGQVGELVESKISTSQNAAATGTYLALTSISLTAGEWDICAAATPLANGATFVVGNQTILVVGTTSASATGSTSGYSKLESSYQTTTTTPGPMSAPRISVSLTATTPFYLNVLADYSAGTPQWRGSISARRIR